MLWRHISLLRRRAVNQYGSNTKPNSDFSLEVKHGEYILRKIKAFFILKTISKEEKAQYVK
jgi:hypothetical protein